ncbi:ATP-binding cassette sub-family A member 9 [Gossypium arboreum]|uniref:ATP-binding cassette sub-family A member 9 n=1 Tax=Gossypium arboreum TaxID=29729 RepID=A0A0B0P9B5_GOSAR|nr:ATP-binding cassette sub-family A member 9 [Gossypium arboreum]
MKGLTQIGWKIGLSNGLFLSTRAETQSVLSLTKAHERVASRVTQSDDGYWLEVLQGRAKPVGYTDLCHTAKSHSRV